MRLVIHKSLYLIMYEYDAAPSLTFYSSVCPTRPLTFDTRNGIYGAIDLLAATTLNIPNSAGAVNQYWIRTWGTSAPNYSGIQLNYTIF